jgi:hypothetical protein
MREPAVSGSLQGLSFARKRHPRPGSRRGLAGGTPETVDVVVPEYAPTWLGGGLVGAAVGVFGERLRLVRCSWCGFDTEARRENGAVTAVAFGGQECPVGNGDDFVEGVGVR